MVVQVRYAATDAACLCLLYDRLGPAAAEAARTLAIDRAAAAAAASVDPISPPPSVAGAAATVNGEQSDGAAAAASRVDVEGLYRKGLLGVAMPTRGKDGVLRALGDETGIARMGIGVAEWAEAVALFVNVAGNRYPNEFLDDGRYVTWFAGLRQVCYLMSKLTKKLPPRVPILASVTCLLQSRPFLLFVPI